MDQKFKIIVEAQDKAAAVFAGIKKAVGNITTPLNGVAKAAGNVGQETAKMVGALTAVAAPLAAITGVASVAGVAALATEWGHLGAEVARTAQTIGISTDALQSLRGAAALTGVSADGLSGGLKSLGTTMEDALYGRNQEALIMMNRLGLRMHKTADGAVDTERAFRDLSRAISKIHNPQVEALVARAFGLEEALPLLRQGPEALDAYRAEARRLGAEMTGPQLAAASGFEKSLAGLGLAVQGVKNAIGSDLIPILQPLIERFRDWLAANRAIIAADIAHVVQGLAEAIKQINWDKVIAGAKSFYDSLISGVKWIGGWKNAAIALAVIIESQLILSVLGLVGAIGKFGFVATKSFVTMASYAGPVVRAIGGITMALGEMAVAFFATPVGWFVAGAIAIGVAVYAIYKYWEPIKKFFADLWDSVTSIFDAAWAKIKPIVDGVIDAGKAMGLMNSTPLTKEDIAATAAQVAPDIDNPNGIVEAIPKAAATSVAGAVNAQMAADQAAAAPADDAAEGSSPAAPSADAVAPAAPGGAGGAVTVLVRFENLPRNARASVRTSGNVTASTTIGHTMPTAVAP